MRTDTPAGVVARVGGRAVTWAAVSARAAALRRGPYASHLPPTGGAEERRFHRWVLQLLVREAVVLDAAGLLPPDRPLGTAPPELLARAADRVRTACTAHVTVDEAAVRDYYVRNAADYATPERRRVRQVLCRTAAAAHDVAAEATAGADFGDLARARSTDAGSAGNGGDLGAVRRGELPRAVDDAVFAARPGVLVEPVASSLGWHVLRVEHITPAGRRPYDEVRADIAAELLGEARRRAFSVWLDRQVRETVQLMAGHEHPGDPASAEPSHRH